MFNQSFAAIFKRSITLVNWLEALLLIDQLSVFSRLVILIGECHLNQISFLINIFANVILHDRIVADDRIIIHQSFQATFTNLGSHRPHNLFKSARSLGLIVQPITLVSACG